MNETRLGMLTWLHSADARAAAGSELHRYGLGAYDVDDLLHDVAVRLLAGNLPPDVDNPAGYARRAMQRLAIDLLRGDRVRRDHHVPGRTHDADEPDEPDRPDPAADDPAETAAISGVEDAIRRALHAALARTRTWTVAAALNTLTLRVHPDVALPDDAPRPESGAGVGQADRWAALWLAGEADVFGAGAAARQVRSRKLREVERLLRTVASSVIGGDLDA